MAIRRRINVITPREDTRRALTKTTGASSRAYMNRNKLKEPLKSAAAKKILEANTRREAARKALRLKRRATAAGRLKSRGEK